MQGRNQKEKDAFFSCQAQMWKNNHGYSCYPVAEEDLIKPPNCEPPKCVINHSHTSSINKADIRSAISAGCFPECISITPVLSGLTLYQYPPISFKLQFQPEAEGLILHCVSFVQSFTSLQSGVKCSQIRMIDSCTLFTHLHRCQIVKNQ